MRKVLLTLSFFSVVSFGASAQNISTEPGALAPEHSYMEGVTTPVQKTHKSSVAPPTIFWSEDFSGGFPSDWTNQGFDVDPSTGLRTPNPLAGWEYRGPVTTPTSAVGSRGAFAGAQQSGNLGTPIASPTRANGFIIFDSDYLDNGGNRTTPVEVYPPLHILVS